MLAAHDVGGFEFAALDPLQHGLTGYAKGAHSLAHGQKAVIRLGDETRLEPVGQTNAPRSAGGVLLAGDDAVVEQPVKGRGGDAERDGGLPDGDDVAVGVRRLAEGRDIPVPAQVADAVAVEAKAIGGRAALTVENAGDYGVGIVQPPAGAGARPCPRWCGSLRAATGAGRDRYRSARRLSNAPSDGRKTLHARL